MFDVAQRYAGITTIEVTLVLILSTAYLRVSDRLSSLDIPFSVPLITLVFLARCVCALACFVLEQLAIFSRLAVLTLSF